MRVVVVSLLLLSACGTEDATQPPPDTTPPPTNTAITTPGPRPLVAGTYTVSLPSTTDTCAALGAPCPSPFTDTWGLVPGTLSSNGNQYSLTAFENLWCLRHTSTVPGNNGCSLAVVSNTCVEQTDSNTILAAVLKDVTATCPNMSPESCECGWTGSAHR